MTQEQKRRPENTKTRRKGEGKSIGYQLVVDPGIKDRRRLTTYSHPIAFYYII